MQVTLQELQDYINKIPINQYFNVQVVEIEEGYCKSLTPYNPVLTNFWNTTHGSVYMTVSDMTFFWAISTLTGLGTSGKTSTIEVKTNFLSPSKESDIYAEARVIKNGRRNVYGEVRITNTAGKLLAHSTVMYFKND
ncbi:MAG: PaaI family thioesterase [Syntrophomonas sp.]|nr:PaaI family thioesterase [Syntrophomonas sp.]